MFSLKRRKSVPSQLVVLCCPALFDASLICLPMATYLHCNHCNNVQYIAIGRHFQSIDAQYFLVCTEERFCCNYPPLCSLSVQGEIYSAKFSPTGATLADRKSVV